MQTYKARIIYDIVVQGKDSTDALAALENTVAVDGVPYQIERFTRVNSIDELPRGWTGDELAFYSNLGVKGEQSIKYWLRVDRPADFHDIDTPAKALS